MKVRISGGKHRGRQISSSANRRLRPTTELVRSALFSMIGLEAIKGANVLDLYAGTGIMAMEAISRGAEIADIVEVDLSKTKNIEKNLKHISMIDQVTIYRGKVIGTLGKLTRKYDLVFADPPYDTREWDQLMSGLSNSNVLAQGSVIFAEHLYNHSLEPSYGSLERVSERKYGHTGISMYKEKHNG